MSIALKNYSKFTLIGDNWQEQRTTLPPLRTVGGSAVTADYGFRLFQTEGSAHYQDPAERRVLAPKPRFGMVCEETLNEAAYAYGAGIPASNQLDATTVNATVSRAPTAEVSISKTSTIREANIGATSMGASAARSESKTIHDIHYSMHAPAAGSLGGSMPLNRGRRTVGITGEVIRLDQDPKNNTAAQRAWLGRMDPSIAAHLNPPAAPEDKSYMSLTLPSDMVGQNAGRGNTTAMSQTTSLGLSAHIASTVNLAHEGSVHGRLAAFQGAPRIVTSITATQKEISMRKGRSVFVDDMY